MNGALLGQPGMAILIAESDQVPFRLHAPSYLAQMAFRLRRRWFQFSLRTLLVLMLFTGTTFGPLAARMHRKRAERAAVKEVIARGGSVGYERAWVRLPRTWTKYLGDDFAMEVTELRFATSSHVQNEQLVCIKKLPLLRSLFLEVVGIDDRGVAHLENLARLKVLRLSGRTVTDSALAHIKPLQTLRHLDLSTSGITDAGLVDVAALTDLVSLNLGGTAVTDEGLRHLAKLEQLRSLGLVLTDVTDQGVDELQKALPACMITVFDRQAAAVARDY
jgi:hypothetical protein